MTSVEGEKHSRGPLKGPWRQEFPIRLLMIAWHYLAPAVQICMYLFDSFSPCSVTRITKFRLKKSFYADTDGLPVSTRFKVATPSQREMIGGTPLALCPPVTASDCWAGIIVPCWHESPQEIPPTKRPSGWNVGTARILGSLGPGQRRARLEGHVTRGGMLEAGVGGGRWRGEPARLVKDLGTRGGVVEGAEGQQPRL